MRCPYYEVCVTPQWYRSNIRLPNGIYFDFTKNVCKTKKYKECTHYMSLTADKELKPNTERWKEVRDYIIHNPLYKEEFNPSKREKIRK